MGLFDAFKGHSDDFHHKGHLTHDAIAGAAAFEAVKAYEAHCAKNGKPGNHVQAKELLAAFGAAALTRLAETKGRDAWDAHKQKQAQEKLTENINTVIVNEYD